MQRVGTLRVVLAALLSLSLVSGCGSSGSSSDKKGAAGPSEVALEKVSSPTANPFTPPVGNDEPKVQPPPATASGGRTTFVASLPGLYGGTRDSASCDADKLLAFLDSSPAKATAWAQVYGITRSQIPDFVDDLTPVLLRTDTRVTNHGFVNGVANPIPALLQAGTAVFVNRYGEPVVKCYCGNPLTVATPLASPHYVGPQWTGYAPGQITIIERSITIINNYTLYDPDTGKLFARPAGTDGTSDKPAKGGTEPPPLQPEPTTTQPETPPTQTQEAPSTPQEQPSASISPSSGTVNDTYTLNASGFAPNATLQITLTRPDGVSENYSFSTGDAGTGSFTFPHSGDPPLGTYTALVVNPNTGAEAHASTTVSG